MARLSERANLTQQWWFIAICMIGGTATWISIGAFAIGGLRDGLLRKIMFTTVDRNVLGEVASTSMKPITVTLQVNRKESIMTDGGQIETGRQFDRKLTITAPAAFFHEILTKGEPAKTQHVGLSVWSRRFDPSQPDAMEWRLAGRKGSKVDRADTNYVRRMEGGEHELRFRVSNWVVARQIFVRYRHRDDWEAEFDRIQQFLTSVATEKLGPGEKP